MCSVEFLFEAALIVSYSSSLHLCEVWPQDQLVFFNREMRKWFAQGHLLYKQENQVAERAVLMIPASMFNPGILLPPNHNMISRVVLFQLSRQEPPSPTPASWVGQLAKEDTPKDEQISSFPLTRTQCTYWLDDKKQKAGSLPSLSVMGHVRAPEVYIYIPPFLFFFIMTLKQRYCIPIYPPQSTKKQPPTNTPKENRF